jgi:hypothetical protein
MNPLPFLGAAERRAASVLRSFAEDSANVWQPGQKAPGNDPRHVLRLGDMRCVFSVSKAGTRLYRHLTISVSNRTRLPNPSLVEEVGHLLGFDGSLTDWFVSDGGGLIILIQEIQKTAAA